MKADYFYSNRLSRLMQFPLTSPRSQPPLSLRLQFTP